MTAQHRLQKLHAIMRRQSLDIAALIPGPNLRYLTGLEQAPSQRPVVCFFPLDDAPIAVLPRVELPLFQRLLPDLPRFVYDDGMGCESAFRDALAFMGSRGQTLGLEGDNMRQFEADLIRSRAPGLELVDAAPALKTLRLRKSADEIAAIRRAIAISEKALEAMLAQTQAGQSEGELASILEREMIRHGSQGNAFETLLHAGANTALPHTPPLDYRLRPGDPLLVDFGARYAGYCADITRTFFFGAATERQRELYAIVQAANAAGRAAAKPGVTAESVDIAARRVIELAGFGGWLRHRVGHGLGLLAHEPPYIVRGNTLRLEPGMVFTIEPGIYRIGDIGIRIEDDVLITDDGADCLTRFPRELVVL